MEILDETSTELPAWARWLMTAFAVLFALLAVWLAELIARGGWITGIAAGLCAALALMLLVAAVRGRVPQWVWLLIWSPIG